MRYMMIIAEHVQLRLAQAVPTVNIIQKAVLVYYATQTQVLGEHSATLALQALVILV